MLNHYLVLADLEEKLTHLREFLIKPGAEQSSKL